MRRSLSCLLGIVCVLTLWSAPADATTPPAPDSIPAEDEEDQGEVVTGTPEVQDPNAPEPTAPPLPVAPAAPTATTIPAGCEQPIVPAAVFIGVLIAADPREAVGARTGRFRVSKVELGSLAGHEVNGLVDIDFGRDVRFLKIGRAYKVTAEVDSETQRLRSLAKPEAPLFGGDQVVGVNDLSGIVCPEIVNPIITVNIDGSSIDTGLLSPLLSAKKSALERVVRPVVIAVASLAALVYFKRIVLWLVVRVRYWWQRRSFRGATTTESRPSSTR